MNFFMKNKIVFWLLIFLVIINLTALFTFGVFYFRRPAAPGKEPCAKTCNAFRKELSLSDAQAQKVETILAAYRESTRPFSGEVQDCRVKLLEELGKPAPDSVLMNECLERITVLQKQIQKASVKQYLELKKICTPDQCRRLSALYYELYGCQGKEACKGKEQGRGKMHRGGHGGKCMEN